MISFIQGDQNDYDNNLCNGINHDKFTLTNKGIGDINITKLSKPEDYSITKLDVDLKNYKHRKDRNLIVNNEYCLG